MRYLISFTMTQKFERLAFMSKNEELKGRIGDKKIAEEEFRSITKLLGDVAMLSGPFVEKRRLLISGLADLIDADGWLWTAGRVDPANQIPMQTEMLSGGLTDHQLAALLDSPSDTASPSPCDQALANLVEKGNHFVRTRQQLVDDDSWYNNANTKTYFLQHGVDHCMYAITPFPGTGFGGIGFFRNTGRPPFSEQQHRIVHIVTREVRWLHDSTRPNDQGAAVEQLTPRLRTVLTLLFKGYICNEIATLLHLSPHTIKGYIRDIYRHFDVKSQLSLIRHFRETTPAQPF